VFDDIRAHLIVWRGTRQQKVAIFKY